MKSIALSISLAVAAIVGLGGLIGCLEAPAPGEADAGSAPIEGPFDGINPNPFPLPWDWDFDLPPPLPPSCEGRCGGMGGPPSASAEPCSCAVGCEADGTCCDDYATACPALPDSCYGACGGQAPAGCWCDDACAGYGDCCIDAEPACHALPPVIPTAGTSRAVATAIASAGTDMIIAGVFEGTLTLGKYSFTQTPGDIAQDAFVAKISSTGEVRWARSFGGTGQDWPQSVAVDGQGFVYVAGHFFGTVDFGTGSRTSAGNTDAFVLYLSPEGTPQWVRTFGGANYDAVKQIVSGDRRWVYLSGTAVGAMPVAGGSLPAGSAYVAAIDHKGTLRWARRYDTGGGAPPAIALGPLGDLFVAAGFTGTVDVGHGPVTSSGSRDVLVARYDAEGVPVVSTFAFGGPGAEYVTSLGVDAWGDVFVTGGFDGSLTIGAQTLTAATSKDVFLAAFRPNGTPRWARHLRGIHANATPNEAPQQRLAVDPAGNVWYAGYFNRATAVGGPTLTPNATDSVLVGYTNAGAFRSQRHLTGAGAIFATTVAADRHGRAYAFGYFYDRLVTGAGTFTNTGGTDLFLVRAPD